MDAAHERELTAYLAGFISARRRARIERVLAERTRWITVMLENVYQPHNSSAVLRSCDCFGVQDVHVVEEENDYVVNAQIDMGASRWLTLHRHAQTPGCAALLKERGYRLIAATPHTDDCLLEELPVDEKLAIVLGTEDEGLTSEAEALADGFLRVPMYGFTESLNVSVCAALILRELTRKVRSTGVNWELEEREKQVLRLAWYRRSMRGVKLIEKRFWSEREEKQADGRAN